MRNDGHDGAPGCSPDFAPKAQRDWHANEFDRRRQAKARGNGSACLLCIGSKPGCCYQVVTLSWLEAQLILETIVDGDDLLDDEQVERIHAAAKREQEFFGNPERSIVETALVEASDAAERYMEAGIHCVFLTKEGRCGIYPARPNACSVYCVSPGTEPSDCAPGPAGMIGSFEFVPLYCMTSLVRQTSIAESNGLPQNVYLGVATAVSEVMKWHEKQTKETP